MKFLSAAAVLALGVPAALSFSSSAFFVRKNTNTRAEIRDSSAPIMRRRRPLMNLSQILAFAAPGALAFSRPATFVRRSSSSTALKIGGDPNVDLGGNAWKPDSEKMGATDTGDYFPEGYDPNAIEYTEGMGGSQAMLGGNRDGPALPGLENIGADAVVTGGIEVAEGIPEGMEFVASSVPDGELDMRVFASAGAMDQTLMVAPVCMTFEDYFASFTADSHPSLSVSPAVGRMDRRGGEPTEMKITCDPRGQAGTFSGDLVINLPEDNSKICYKVNVVSQ